MREAIKTLEQEPCDVPDTNVGDLISREDAVSRKALISHIENQSREWGEDYDTQQILGDIEDMPSVKPQTGHWVKGKCDQCGGHAPFWSMATTYYESEYCPKCGAKMVKPNMSENPTSSEKVRKG